MAASMPQWDNVARRPEQWTGVVNVLPRGQPSSRDEVVLEERNRWALASPKPLTASILARQSRMLCWGF